MRKCSLCWLLILAMSCLGYTAHAMPQDGLVLYYTFDKVSGNNVSDESGEGYDGTLNGGATVQDGILTLDGQDGYVGMEALQIRTGGEIPFTALAWFRTDEAANGPLWMWGDNAIPSASSGAEAPVGWRTGTGMFAAGFYQGAHFYADATEEYADGEWHFVAQVGEEGTGYLYIDGEQISSTTAGYTYAGPPFCLIGARTKNSGSEIDDIEYFQGSFETVALYNRAMDENEISAVAAEPQAAVTPHGKLAVAWGKLRY